MINLVWLLLINKSLQSDVSLIDFIEAKKITTNQKPPMMKLQNLTPSFNEPKNTWLIFKIHTDEHNELFYACFNFDNLQNLKFQKSFDIGFSTPTTQTNSYSPLIFKQSTISSPSNNCIPATVPHRENLQNNFIIFLTTNKSHKNLQHSFKTISNSLTFIYKLFELFTSSFLNNLTTTDSTFNTNASFHDLTYNPKYNKTKHIISKDTPDLSTHLKSLLRKENKEFTENELYFNLYKFLNHKIHFLGFSFNLDFVTKNRKEEINYKTDNFNIQIYQMENITQENLIEEIKYKKYEISALKIILNELQEIVKENTKEIFKVNISNAKILYNETKESLNTKEEKEEIIIRKKNKRKRAKKKSIKKTIINNETKFNNYNSNPNSINIEYDELNVKINNRHYSVYKKLLNLQTCDNSYSNNTAQINENINTQKVTQLVCQCLRENKGFTFKFGDDKKSYKLELNLEKVVLSLNSVLELEHFQFGLNKLDFNAIVMLLYDTLSMVDLMLSSYFNILSFEDKNDFYNKTLISNLVVLKEEFENLIEKFFEMNNFNEFIEKYKKHYKSKKEEENKENKKEEEKFTNINNNINFNDLYTEEDYLEDDDETQSKIIKKCNTYIKIVTFGVLNFNETKINKPQIYEIYTKNANKSFFVINEFMMEIVSINIATIINNRKNENKINEQLGIILLEYLDIETSFRINTNESEKYIFKESGFKKNKNRENRKELEKAESDNLAVNLRNKRQIKRVFIDGLKKVGDEFYLGNYDKIIRYLAIRLFDDKQWQEIFYKLNTLLFGLMIELTKFTLFMKEHLENI